LDKECSWQAIGHLLLISSQNRQLWAEIDLKSFISERRLPRQPMLITFNF